MQDADECMLELDGDDTRALTVREFNRRMRLLQKNHYGNVLRALHEQKLRVDRLAERLESMCERVDALQNSIERDRDRWKTIFMVIGGLGALIAFLFSAADGIQKLFRALFL